MVGVCYHPSSSSKRFLSDCACTLPLFITTYTVLFTLALANLPDVWNGRLGGALARFPGSCISYWGGVKRRAGTN
jgi:hypothetical protein